jgi:DNA-binding MarR family transcriptional regulator
MRLLGLPEEEKLLPRATFFTPTKKGGKLTQGDQTRRKVLLTMLTNEPLHPSEIGRKTGLAYSYANEIADSFVQAGLAERKEISNHGGVRPFVYELTKAGKLFGLGISVEWKTPLGLDYHSLFTAIFETKVTDDAGTKFANLAVIHAEESGLLNRLLDMAREVAIECETSDESVNFGKLYGKIIPDTREERNVLRTCYRFGFESLDNEDRDAFLSHFKSMMVETYHGLAMRTRDRKWQALAVMCSNDPKNIYYPITCEKCGYHNFEAHASTFDYMISHLSSDEHCPRCNRVIPRQTPKTKPIYPRL